MHRYVRRSFSGVTVKKNDSRSRGTAERKRGRTGSGLSVLGLRPVVVADLFLFLSCQSGMCHWKISQVDFQWTEGRTERAFRQEGNGGEGGHPPPQPICLCPEQTHFEPICGQNRTLSERRCLVWFSVRGGGPEITSTEA